MKAVGRNPTCYDCGRRIGWDEAIAIPLNGKRIFLCPSCYQESLMAIRNPKVPRPKRVIGRREYRFWMTTANVGTWYRQKEWLKLRGYHVRTTMDGKIYTIWTIPPLKWVSYKELKKSPPGRVVRLDNPRKALTALVESQRKPTKTEKAGNALGGGALLAIPVIVFLILYFKNK